MVYNHWFNKSDMIKNMIILIQLYALNLYFSFGDVSLIKVLNAKITPTPKPDRHKRTTHQHPF